MANFRDISIYTANGDLTKEWFVYYYYLVPPGLRKPGGGDIWKRIKVSKTVNSFNTKSKRLKRINLLKSVIENLLNSGYSPFSEYNYSDRVEYEGYTVINCIDKYLSEVQGGLRKGTLKTYSIRLHKFKEWLIANNMDFYNMHHVSKGLVFKFLKENQAVHQWANKTFNHYLSALHTFFEYYLCNYDNYIEVNPCAKLKRLEPLKKGNRPFTGTDLEDVLKYCRDHEQWQYNYLGVFMKHIYYSCMRPDAELRMLQLYDVDLVNKRIAVYADTAKSKATQWIPIDDSYLNMLKHMKLEKFPRDFYLFGKEGLPGPEPTYEGFFNKWFRKVKRELKLHPDTTLYAAKHTSAIHKVQDKMDLYDVIKFTRHKSLAELMDYLKDMQIVIGETKKFASREL